MEISSTVVSLPPTFVTVIVYDLDSCLCEGVPEMTPVLLSSVSPLGRSGWTITA